MNLATDLSVHADHLRGRELGVKTRKWRVDLVEMTKVREGMTFG